MLRFLCMWFNCVICLGHCCLWLLRFIQLYTYHANCLSIVACWFTICVIAFHLYDRLTSNMCRILMLQVKDTVQVDQNVSRHLSDELSRYDWDLLVSLTF